MNNIQFTIYQGISTTPRFEAMDDMLAARLMNFSGTFPTGQHVALNLFVPRRVSEVVPWSGGDKIVARDGVTIVWEGLISATGYAINEGDEGVQIQAIGFYGFILGGRTLDKRWADNRISPDIWVIDTTNSTAYDLATLERINRLRILPKQSRWAYQFVYGLVYTMPTGQTIKRAVMDYDHDINGYITPEFAKWNNDPGAANTFTDMTNALDGDSTTHYDLTLTSDDYIYIGVKDLTNVNLIRFDMGTTVNAVAATMAVEYYAAATDTAAAAWTSLTITDGTASGGATLAQDGNMTFVLPDDIIRFTVDDENAYWFRLQSSANLTASIDIVQIYVGEILSWRLRLRDRTGSTDIWSTSSTSSASRDDTLGTPRQSLAIEYIADSVQLARNDGSYFAEITNIMMYSETNATITAGVIAADVLTEAGDINAYTAKIGDPSLALEPFYTEGPELLASILERAIGYGDSSYNSWYARLLDSEKASSIDGKPVLQVAQYPALTDYDYVVSLDDPNLVGNIQFIENTDGIINYVTVIYRNTQGDQDIILTPDDDSELKDADSITTYGERHILQPINLGVANSTLALNIGKRFLADNKDPKYYVSGPIRVSGYIRGKNGNRIPASQIESGKRLKIENYLNDLVGTSGAGLTQIISDATYTEDGSGEYCDINLEGLPDSLAILLAQRNAGFLATAGKNLGTIGK